MQEEWKIIKNFPNYMISNLGRIKSLNYKRTNKEQILKQNINGRGYYYVNISVNNKYHNLLIHREVATAFLNNNKNYSDVNHKDGNKLNNNVNNLEWCTRSHNIQHAYNNGLKKGGKGKTYKKRCELAIEYINEHKRKDEFLNLNEWQTRDLLEILKGVEK